MSRHLETPDGRYFVVNGRLWRCTNPALPPEVRARLTRRLMRARRAVLQALRSGDERLLGAARARVGELKVQLGERGAPWWTDGAPDYNKRHVGKTPYAEWYASVSGRETRDTQLYWPEESRA